MNSKSPLDEELMVKCLPQMSAVRVTVSKRYLLEQAVNTLGLTIVDHDQIDMGEHGLIASISINLSPHRGWEVTEPKMFYGDFESTSLKAAESANLSAINYLQENNIVVFDDANLQPLKKCIRELLQATSWSWGFELCSIQLKKRIKNMGRDGVQPLASVLSFDDDIPNTPLSKEPNEEFVTSPEANPQIHSGMTNTPASEVMPASFPITNKLTPGTGEDEAPILAAKRGAKRALFAHDDGL
ncbi:uncharacterized protein LOC125541444 [Triticum urartu]|uniref:uncharacterized protein LOC125541444 n=1 Tax=Triticum urartu TaxID=4572 RepID=UPI0020446F88|nr:uncharacterized protein LOC125541444 [Triticum urartu]